MFCDPITPNEIASAVSTFSNNKSQGPDNINPKLLKYLLNDIVNLIVYIFNLFLTSGCFPQSLKTAKVIPLYKKAEISNPEKNLLMADQPLLRNWPRKLPNSAK